MKMSRAHVLKSGYIKFHGYYNKLIQRNRLDFIDLRLQR